MTALAELLRRVEASEGPDRELDAHILCATIAPEGSKVEQSNINGAWCIYEPRPYGKEPFGLWSTPSPFRQMEGVTASIDAAVALVERVLPGCRWSINRDDLDPPFESVIEQGKLKEWHGHATAATAAMSLLAALLKALIAQRGKG